MPLCAARRQFLGSALVACLAPIVTGCGTIFFPERRGQPAGRLDWRVVILDGIGLLFFFVPGVIAFAVDFSNGTIYLPPDEYSRTPPPGSPPGLVSIPAGKKLSIEDVERRVTQETGKTVKLVPGEYQSARMESLDEFDQLCQTASNS